MRLSVLSCAVLAFAVSAAAQDVRSVSSPDGQLVVRIFTATQEGRELSRLAYQADYQGKPAITTSYLGLNLWEQEPMLGENMGLVETKSEPGHLIVRYMQNGSLARRLDVEIRVFNEGFAFRYTVGTSIAVPELLIDDEGTQVFNVIPVSLGEKPKPGFPVIEWVQHQRFYATKLPKRFDGHAPYTGPWRVVALSDAGRAQILKQL